jgi:hypothetical protein
VNATKIERIGWTCSPMDGTETRTPLDSPTGLVGAHTGVKIPNAQEHGDINTELDKRNPVAYSPVRKWIIKCCCMYTRDHVSKTKAIGLLVRYCTDVCRHCLDKSAVSLCVLDPILDNMSVFLFCFLKRCCLAVSCMTFVPCSQTRQYLSILL